ncbi:protein kinase domain-containing protein [Streptomyces xantholiticus]|uniref:protein kinase domain-containing protein n=1 Tax=Streptomyces xantholiticus TaxID=68285 RepID=UPI001675474B|nr:protein kinase [Streptomyces xantholiticus]
MEFAAALRQLRQDAGNPSYEAMSKRVGYGRATLNAAALGRNLPSKDVTLAFVEACRVNQQAMREWARRWEATKAQLEQDLEKEAARSGAEERPAAGRRARAGERTDAGREGTRHETLPPLGANDPRQAGGFRLLSFLGAGAMGRVYLGESMGGRQVAIKVIDGARAGDPEFRARFRQEIAAARRVHGMFTAAVVAADPDAEDPWLATEYVPGPSLQEVVSEQGPMQADTVIRLAAGIAEALAAIHGADVVHRDLKPGNVLLATDGPKVIDFGIARTRDATTLTRTQMLVGTPGYVAPERLTKGKAGPACDVFSLGALLAFASTGRLPFGNEPAEISFRIVHGEPDLEAVPEELRELVAWCLAKNPDKRPSPRQVIDWCCERAGQPGPGWLPAPLTDMIRRRAREAAEIRVPDRETDRDPSRPRRRIAPVVLATAAVTAVVLLAGALVNLNPGKPNATPSITSSPTGGSTADQTAGPPGGSTPGPTGRVTSGPGNSAPGGTTQGPTGGTSSVPTQGATSGATPGKTAGATQGPGDDGLPSPSTSEGSSRGPTAGVSTGTGEDNTRQEPILMGRSVYVQPRSDTADCTRPITFTFSASARRTGTINYTWYPDEFLTDRGVRPRTGSMTFTTPNTQYETFEVQLQGTKSGDVVQGHMSLEITSPQPDRGSNGDQFHLTCS